MSGVPVCLHFLSADARSTRAHTWHGAHSISSVQPASVLVSKAAMLCPFASAMLTHAFFLHTKPLLHSCDSTQAAGFTMAWQVNLSLAGFVGKQVRVPWHSS